MIEFGRLSLIATLCTLCSENCLGLTYSTLSGFPVETARLPYILLVGGFNVMTGQLVPFTPASFLCVTKTSCPYNLFRSLQYVCHENVIPIEGSRNYFFYTRTPAIPALLPPHPTLGDQRPQQSSLHVACFQLSQSLVVGRGSRKNAF